MGEYNEQTRRGFLAALATTGIGVAAVSGVASADDSDPAGSGGAGSPQGGRTESFPTLRTEAFPAPTPGTSYMLAVGAEFIPRDSTMVYDKGFGQVSTTAATSVLLLPLSGLPTGARITEVSAAIVKLSGTNNASFFIYRFTSGSIATLDSKDSTALAAAPTEQNLTLTVGPTDDWVIDNSLLVTHWLVITLAAGGRLNSVRVGYTNPTPPFHPIAPKRVYDSRFVAPLGPIPSNTNRIVSVANAYANDSAVVSVADIVPIGAKAIAYNVTVANTVGSGFLSVNPGDATTAGGSSINWFGTGQVLANGLVVTLDASRQIKVFCGGGGSTDFLIDVLGYYA
jgi:hypothetical protein